MKNSLLLIILFFLGLYNFSYSQIPIGNKIIPPTNVSSGYIHINAFSTIETAGNHNYNGNSNTLFEAGETIILNPGFEAGGFNGNGTFEARINQHNVDVVKFSPYSTSNDVGKYEKFEIGLKLSDEIETKIHNYIYNLSGVKINPYLESEIDIVVKFTSTSNRVINKPAFYYENFSGRNTTTNKWNYDDQPYKFRVRFAPDEIGNWRYEIKINVNGVLVETVQSLDFKFNCVPSNKKGYLEVGQHKRQFRFNDTQTSFFAVGQNVPWVNAGNWGTNNFTSDAFTTYMNWIQNLKDNDGNYFRMLLATWSHGIEWENLGDYGNFWPASSTNINGFNRQISSWEIDNLVNFSENNNLFFEFVLLMHNEFEVAPEVAPLWAWNHSPYYPLISPYISASKFWSNTNCQSFFKNKLRYILARWGYSTSISAWELTSEANNYDQFASATNDCKNWHQTMSSYLKFHDNNHMVTSSYFGDILNINDNVFDIPTIDFVNWHGYASDKGQNFFRKKVLNKIRDKWDKPVIIEESGQGLHISPFFDDGFLEDCDVTNFHNSYWSSAFMECYGSGLNWWAYQHNEGRTHTFRALNSFFSDVDFEVNEFRKNQTDKTGSGNDFVIETFAMSNKSSNRLMGWVHQATYYWANLSTCNNITDNLGNSVTNIIPSDDDSYSSPIYSPNRKFTITGMKPLKKHDIHFFKTFDNGGLISSLDDNFKSNIFGNKSIDFPDFTENNIHFTDFGFKIEKRSTANRIASGSNETIENDTLECYQDTIKVTNFASDDSTFVNAKIFINNALVSNNLDTNIVLNSEGFYNVKIILYFTSHTDTLEQAIIALDKCSSNNTRRAISQKIDFDDVLIVQKDNVILSEKYINCNNGNHQLFDITGRLVSQNNSILNIINSVGRGVYLLKMNCNNQITSIKLLIK